MWHIEEDASQKTYRNVEHADGGKPLCACYLDLRGEYGPRRMISPRPVCMFDSRGERIANERQIGAM